MKIVAINRVPPMPIPPPTVVSITIQLSVKDALVLHAIAGISGDVGNVVEKWYTGPQCADRVPSVSREDVINSFKGMYEGIKEVLAS